VAHVTRTTASYYGPHAVIEVPVPRRTRRIEDGQKVHPSVAHSFKKRHSYQSTYRLITHD